MPSIVGQRPPNVEADLNTLRAGLDAPINIGGVGGVPCRTDDQLLIATWNVRELGRYTDLWATVPGDHSPARDIRSILFIGEVMKRFDVVAVQEIQNHTSAIRLMLSWMNHGQPGRYDLIVSDVTWDTDGDNEHLGFVYDTSRVRFSGLAGEHSDIVALGDFNIDQLSEKRYEVVNELLHIGRLGRRDQGRSPGSRHSPIEAMEMTVPPPSGLRAMTPSRDVTSSSRCPLWSS